MSQDFFFISPQEIGSGEGSGKEDVKPSCSSVVVTAAWDPVYVLSSLGFSVRKMIGWPFRPCPGGRQCYRIECLHPQTPPVTAALSRDVIKGTPFLYIYIDGIQPALHLGLKLHRLSS
jgi:hypothetical protein